MRRVKRASSGLRVATESGVKTGDKETPLSSPLCLLPSIPASVGVKYLFDVSPLPIFFPSTCGILFLSSNGNDFALLCLIVNLFMSVI